jgi:hypothetical protein
MANYRQIHVSIWKDTWFLDLEPDEKLLFIYLFSNESSSLSGIYRVSRKVVAFETGLDKARVDEVLSKFSAAGKVQNEGDIIWIVNMRRFHETKSIKVQTRISGDIADVPDCQIKRNYIAYHEGNIRYRYPIDTAPQLKEKEQEEKQEEEYEQEDLEKITNAVASKNIQPFRILYDAFLEASNCKESLINPPKAADAINLWLKEKITPEEVKQAVEEMQQKELTIVGPWSVTNAINIVRAKGRGKKKEVTRSSEEARSKYAAWNKQ